MKTKFRHAFIALAFLALSTFNPRLSTAYAQGALTPPGAPGPTMITLNQIEPRIPISSLPFTITTPGSYYVTTNLTGASGININAGPFTENVTVDLNGFTLTGVAGSVNGISAGNNGHNYVFRNGTLRNWGGDGINAFGSINSRFEKLQLYGNANVGLQAGANCVVSDCAAYSNVVAGVSALNGGDLSHCAAANNGIGIQTLNGCVVADCTASGNTGDGINVGTGTLVRSCTSYQNGEGIIGGNNSTINDCTVSSNSLVGISVGNNCNIKDCNASANRGDGIFVANNCTVKDCTASTNKDDGINIDGSGCQIAGNTCGGNGQSGIEIEINGQQNRIDNNSVGNNVFSGILPDNMNVGNIITRNFAPGMNYANFSGNNDYAPVQAPSTATSPWANFQ